MPKSTGRRQRLQAGARKESILAVAIPEFANSGYERTRVSDIAIKVGVTEPVVFQNFGTKSGLFIAALDRAAREVVNDLSVLRERSPDVPQLLAALLSHEHLDRIHSRGGLGMMFAEAADNSEPSIRKAGRQAHTHTVHAVAELLRHGQADGSIRKDVDAVTLAGLVLSQIHARQFRHAHTDTSPTLERAMLTALLDVLRPQQRG
jgi:AcrR family transcriptional regulator